MRARQSGKLHELNILGAILAVAGIALASTHPGFFAITIAGLTLPFIPQALEAVHAWRGASRARERWQALQAEGFRPTAWARARRGEGGAYVGVDADSGRIAFVTGEQSETFPFAAVQLLKLTRGQVFRWGEVTTVRHGFCFVAGEREFGLSFPRRGEAVRAFNDLRRPLEGKVAIDATDPREPR